MDRSPTRSDDIINEIDEVVTLAFSFVCGASVPLSLSLALFSQSLFLFLCFWLDNWSTGDCFLFISTSISCRNTEGTKEIVWNWLENQWRFIKRRYFHNIASLFAVAYMILARTVQLQIEWALIPFRSTSFSANIFTKLLLFFFLSLFHVRFSTLFFFSFLSAITIGFAFKS